MGRIRVSVARQAFGKSLGPSRVGTFGGRSFQAAKTRTGTKRLFRALSESEHLDAFDRDTAKKLVAGSENEELNTDRVRRFHRNVSKLHAAGKLPGGFGLTFEGRKGWTTFQKSLTPPDTKADQEKLAALRADRDRRLMARRERMNAAAQREAERQRGTAVAKPVSPDSGTLTPATPLQLGATRGLPAAGGQTGTDRIGDAQAAPPADDGDEAVASASDETTGAPRTAVPGEQTPATPAASPTEKPADDDAPAAPEDDLDNSLFS